MKLCIFQMAILTKSEMRSGLSLDIVVSPWEVRGTSLTDLMGLKSIKSYWLPLHK